MHDIANNTETNRAFWSWEGRKTVQRPKIINEEDVKKRSRVRKGGNYKSKQKRVCERESSLCRLQ